jgi:hypothetical protein
MDRYIRDLGEVSVPRHPVAALIALTEQEMHDYEHGANHPAAGPDCRRTGASVLQFPPEK